MQPRIYFFSFMMPICERKSVLGRSSEVRDERAASERDRLLRALPALRAPVRAAASTDRAERFPDEKCSDLSIVLAGVFWIRTRMNNSFLPLFCFFFFFFFRAHRTKRSYFSENVGKILTKKKRLQSCAKDCFV